MKKEFKTGDKIFYTETNQYGIFVDYSKCRDDEAVVNLFYGDNFEEAVFVSLCFLEKAIIKKYEVFWKFYIDNDKNLEGVKKEIFDEENEAIEYLKTKRDDYGINWIEGNIVEVKSKEIFRL
jgi:hypothetical protein